jgi:hypothetical protein
MITCSRVMPFATLADSTALRIFAGTEASLPRGSAAWM